MLINFAKEDLTSKYKCQVQQKYPSIPWKGQAEDRPITHQACQRYTYK